MDIIVKVVFYDLCLYFKAKHLKRFFSERDDILYIDICTRRTELQNLSSMTLTHFLLAKKSETLISPKPEQIAQKCGERLLYILLVTIEKNANVYALFQGTNLKC